MRRALLMLVVLLAGCGDELVSGGYRPPYFSLTVHAVYDPTVALTLPRMLPIAILWQTDSSAVGVAVEAGTIPSSSDTGVFTLDINARPPASAIESVLGSSLRGVDPALRWTAGTVVAYLDNNHNGMLDLADTVTLDGDHDRIIGAAADPGIDGANYTLYDIVAGQPGPPVYLGVVPTAPNFSIVQEPPRVDPPVGSCDAFDKKGLHHSTLCEQLLDGTAQSILPATALLLRIDADPELQRFDCTSFLGPYDYADWRFAPRDQICDGGACPFCQGTACPLDVPPPGVPVTCTSDGLEYAYKSCTEDATKCNTRFCHYGHGARQASDPVPAGWPCPQ